MKAKKIYIIASVFLMSYVLGSCKGDFLDTKPRSEVPFEQLSKDTESLNTLIEGVHNRIYTAWYGDQVFGVGYQSLMGQLDVLGDDLINTKPSFLMGWYRFEVTTNQYNDWNFNYYDYWYTLIMYANQGLTALSKISKDSEGYNQLKGEFHTIRAWSYFNLIQLFAKRYEANGSNDNMGVPLRLTPTYDVKPRASVKEVYAQIDKDIEEGLNSLKDLKPVVDKGGNLRKNRINYAIALDIASRIALVEEKWADAEKYASEGIEKAKSWGMDLEGGESLLDGFNNISSKECMWGYKLADDQSQGYASFFSLFSANFNGHNKGFKFAVNRDIYDKMGEKDVRRKWWICQDLDSLAADYYKGINKPLWENAEETGQSVKYLSVSPSNSMADSYIMRIPELYYNKAEAQARQGKDADAVATLQTVMVTRDPDYKVPEDAKTGEKLIEEIFRNKRIEFWLEGFRFFDLKRTKQPIIRTSKNAEILGKINPKRKEQAEDRAKNYTPITSMDDPRWELQIPYSEVKGSHGQVKLNPVYNPQK